MKFLPRTRRLLGTFRDPEIRAVELGIETDDGVLDGHERAVAERSKGPEVESR